MHTSSLQFHFPCSSNRIVAIRTKTESSSGRSKNWELLVIPSNNVVFKIHRWFKCNPLKYWNLSSSLQRQINPTYIFLSLRAGPNSAISNTGVNPKWLQFSSCFPWAPSHGPTGDQGASSAVWLWGGHGLRWPWDSMSPCKALLCALCCSAVQVQNWDAMNRVGMGLSFHALLFMASVTEAKSDTFGGIMSALSKVPRKTVFV